MALWQFITFTALIGALLVYASVITRRLGCADARLNRIEQALLAKSRPPDSADARAAEAEPEIISGQERHERHLTIGDLRQLSSYATRSSSPNYVAVSERRRAPNTPPGPMRSPGVVPQRAGSVAIGSESEEALRARGEQLTFPDTRPLTVNSVPTGLAGRAALATSREPLTLPIVDAVSGRSAAMTSASSDARATNSARLNPPGYRLADDDSVAKKNRDMALFLSSQRRRRRARLGL